MKHLTFCASVLLWGLVLSSPCSAQIFTTIEDPLATNGSEAYGVDGQNVVGWFNDTSGRYGFLYNGTDYTTLEAPSAYAANGGTTATGISGNNIVGFYRTSDAVTHGFLYNNGTYSTLDDPLATQGAGGGTLAIGISGNTVVGLYIDASGDHGFIYQGGTYTTVTYPSATETELYGISGNSLIGSYTDASGTHGFLDQNGVFSTLSFGPLGISGNDMVGTGGNGLGSNPYGFLFDGTNLTTINDPLGVKGTDAYGISGNTIVGGYYDSNDVVYAYETTIESVPEPASWTLSALAAVVFSLMVWWKRKRTS